MVTSKKGHEVPPATRLREESEITVLQYDIANKLYRIRIPEKYVNDLGWTRGQRIRFDVLLQSDNKKVIGGPMLAVRPFE